MARLEHLTESVIERRWAAMQSHYAQRNQNILAWRSMYFRKHQQYFLNNQGVYTDPEPDEIRIVLPIAPFTVEAMRELLFTKAPAISVPVSTAKGIDRDQADHNEKALLAMWHWSKLYSVARDSLWFALTAGWGVLETLWDKSGSDDESPIVIIAHDPFNVYPCPGKREGQWEYVLLAWPRLVGEIRDEWETNGDKRTAAWKQTQETLNDLEDDAFVTYLEYWDEDYHAVAVNYTAESKDKGEIKEVTNFIKRPVTHGYGFLPWDFYFPCKLPFPRIGERLGVSIFYIIEEMIRYICQLVSKKATMLERWQDPPLVTHTEDGRDLEPLRTEAGLHIKLDINESAEYLINPTSMPLVDTQIALMQDYIERGSIPRVLQGQYVGSISGIAMSLLRNPTLMKVAFKQSAIEEALMSVDKKILHLLEHKLKSPLYAWGQDRKGQDVEVEIDPEQIKSYYRNSVKLSASLPTDDANTVNMLAVLKQLNILSARTIRDVAQQLLHELVPQSLPDEEKRIQAEKILDDPEMSRLLAMATAAEVLGPEVAAALGLGGGQPESPRGGFGERQVRPPAGTLPSQTPGLPGGNVSPGVGQRRQEMMGGLAGETGQTARTGVRG